MKWFIKCFKQYADFKGRARRREFWFFTLFCSIISLILMIGIAVPIVKQIADNTSFYCIDADDDDVKSAIHTENINEENAEEILNMLTEKGIVDLPAEVTDNEDAKIAKAQVVTVNAENLDDETVKDLFDMLQKNGIVDEELSDKVVHNGVVYDSKKEIKNDDGTTTEIHETDYVKRIYNMMTRTTAKNPFYWIYLVFCLAILLPSIAVAVRRLHDLGRSGWWYLLFAVLMALPAIPYYMHLTGILPTFLNLLALAITVFYIVVMCKDSQPGENQWGPNPKELPQSEN